jgi:hypothetical protein
VQREFARINERLETPRDRMDDDVLAHMVAGYAGVDALVAAEVDLFVMGNLKHWLELNTTVLCGRSPGRRQEYARHVAATEHRFYEEREGGIRDVVEWYDRHRRESVWRRAAGVYVRILSKPQLFIEGNHRTGTLAMSYLLLRDGCPPFVLTVENAPGYFGPSSVIRNTAKQSLTMNFRLPGLQRQLAEFLAEHADPRFLQTATLAGDAAPKPPDGR